MLELCTLDFDLLDSSLDSPTVTEDTRTQPQESFRQESLRMGRAGVISTCSTIGKRDRNLDKFDYRSCESFELIAVYDGHGDSTVSNYLQTYLLDTLKAHHLLLADFATAVEETFMAIDSQLLGLLGISTPNTGSTALILMITPSEVFVANLGDSKALAISKSGHLSQLNTQHNLSNEFERKTVASRGGLVMRRGRGYRLVGELNLSRSFGDFKHKPSISIVPEVRRYSKSQIKFLAVGTDGFWEKTSDAEVSESLSEGGENMASLLMETRCKRPSDNATILCYKFQ